MKAPMRKITITVSVALLAASCALRSVDEEVADLERIPAPTVTTTAVIATDPHPPSSAAGVVAELLRRSEVLEEWPLSQEGGEADMLDLWERIGVIAPAGVIPDYALGDAVMRATRAGIAPCGNDHWRREHVAYTLEGIASGDDYSAPPEAQAAIAAMLTPELAATGTTSVASHYVTLENYLDILARAVEVLPSETLINLIGDMSYAALRGAGGWWCPFQADLPAAVRCGADYVDGSLYMAVHVVEEFAELAAFLACDLMPIMRGATLVNWGPANQHQFEKAAGDWVWVRCATHTTVDPRRLMETCSALLSGDHDALRQRWQQWRDQLPMLRASLRETVLASTLTPGTPSELRDITPAIYAPQPLCEAAGLTWTSEGCT